MGIIVTILCVLLTAFSFGCAKAKSTYPSYERTIAKYTPPGEVEGLPTSNESCERAGAACDCPRVWYRDHWVYYCDDQWMYWHHGYWYYYPHFRIYYYDGFSSPHPAPRRRITKE